jgi:hypothetical protein
LNELTKGERSDFGGSFEACLKKYSDPSTRPNERFLTVERSNVRHNTQISPNMDLIEKHLQKMKISYVYTGPNWATKTSYPDYATRTIHRSLKEYVPVFDKVNRTVTRANSEGFLKDVNTDLSSLLRSGLVKIHISTQKHVDVDLQLDEDIKRQLGTLAEQLAKDQGKRKEQFIITLVYVGIPVNLVSLATSNELLPFCDRLSTYFEEWLQRFQGDEISEEDKGSLRKGDFDMLSLEVKEKLRSFLSSIEDTSSNSPLENDNLHLPVITEMYKLCKTKHSK